MEIYLDNSATTRAYPEVAELVTKLMLEDYGNPSALHQKEWTRNSICAAPGRRWQRS